MSRIVLFLIVLVSCCSSLNAQLKSNFRLGIETGYIAFSGSNNLGLFLNIEPKLKSSKNTFIGLRMSLAVNSQTFENSDATQYMIEEEYDNGFFSFVPTFDHYFGKDDLRPYLGVGAGVYVVSSFVDVFHVSGQDPANKKIEVRLNKQVGLLVRGGVEFEHMKLGVEYNFIPRADIEIATGETIGKVKSSYLGLSIGFTIGRWKRSR